MAKIAVAGGTGGFGRILVDELAKGGQHEITVFSRSISDLFKEHTNVKVNTVDYTNEAGLTSAIKEAAASVVISCLNPPFPEVFEAERSLVRAAAASGTVHRFVPSQFAMDMDKPDERLPIEWKHDKNSVVAELRKTTLDWTLFLNGWFMDYWVQPWVSPHMLAEVPFIDIAAKEASIPGDGNAMITFTLTRDVARFIRRAIEDRSRWWEKSFIIGDQATFNDVLDMAQKARNCNFKVKYNDISDLRQNKMDDIPSWRSLYDVLPKDLCIETFSGFGLTLALEDAKFEMSRSLNTKYPDIETTKLEDIIRKYWSGR